MPDADSDHESDSDASMRPAGRPCELVDIGGGDDEGLDLNTEDIPVFQVSSFPLHDVSKTIALCLQQEDIASLSYKKRKSKGDMALKSLDETYTQLLKLNFSEGFGAADVKQRGFGKCHSDMIALQRKTIALAKKHPGC